MTSDDGLWTVEECAKYLKTETSKVKYWARHSQLPIVKLGRQIRFDPKDVKEWVERRKGGMSNLTLQKIR